jgi:hypothetical protein
MIDCGADVSLLQERDGASRHRGSASLLSDTVTSFAKSQAYGRDKAAHAMVSATVVFVVDVVFTYMGGFRALWIHAASWRQVM